MDIYARAGAALVRVDYKDDTGGETHKFNDLKVSPVFAGSLEYAILPELALRLEYQWLVRVGNFGKAERKKQKHTMDQTTMTNLMCVILRTSVL